MNWNEAKQLARELRKNQTKEEEILWRFLRNRWLLGLKFFRQYPIEYFEHGKQCFFIADFYSKEASTVIEIDGKIHLKQKEYDAQRDIIIKNNGLKVLRITNEQVIKGLDKVLKKIEEAINSLLTPL